MGGGKSDFFTMEPPLEPPAVLEGSSDPPELTFRAKMVSRGPPGTQKACQNDPQGTPETQKYQKKTPTIPKKNCKKTIKKDSTNASKSYLYKNVKNISSKPKNETAETIQIIKISKP